MGYESIYETNIYLKFVNGNLFAKEVDKHQKNKDTLCSLSILITKHKFQSQIIQMIVGDFLSENSCKIRLFEKIWGKYGENR
jgi:hypothetical protein